MIKKYSLSFFLIVIAVLFSACAPKQVKIYEGDAELRNNIVKTAMELYGKPYRSGAKGPDAFDCSGFIHFVFKKWGIVLPVNTEGFLKIGYGVNKTNILPGDIVIFKIKKDLHSGIMINRNEFIHASKTKGVGIDNIENNDYWKRGVLGYRRVI
ncbi:MAG: C40 family peptidase [Syntrophorhabdaceae bacterium]|nr:C40 family peptidase [Syntrophorhabdaceae bacterium]